MTIFPGRAAIFAALVFATGVSAQDVTLTARDGALSINGTLQGFDGEFYRLLSPYGPLTVDAQGVLCDGPACPSLTAPKATIRILGPAEAGQVLMPGLFAAFAAERGLQFQPQTQDQPARLSKPDSGEILAELSFRPASPQTASTALRAGAAELVLSSAPAPDMNARPLATDALVPIVAPDNPMPRIASTALARVLAGEVKNWSEIGGPDMPLVLHALPAESDLVQALSLRIGQKVAGEILHPTLAALAQAVAHDPWAIAVTGRAVSGPARILDMTDSCGFPLTATPLAVKAEDYPLALPLSLLTPPRRLPLMAREFLDFLSMPAAQAVIRAAGYADRGEERQPMTADGLRLMNAIRGAGKDVPLADLQKVAAVMDGAERSSLTFRFQDGGATLDAASQGNLALLARMLETGMFRDKALTLVGFSDGSGAARSNLRLSQDRVALVLAALKQAAPDLPPSGLPQTMAFGEAMPLACDQTSTGRWLNRRVELWVRPAFANALAAP